MSEPTLNQMLEEAESSLGVMCASYRLEQELHAETCREFSEFRLEHEKLRRAFLDLHRLAVEVDLANYGYTQRMRNQELLTNAEDACPTN